MIVSHKRRFIFLHCRKTAGSYISVLFNRYLGPKDIQVGSWHETLSAGGKLNERAKQIIFAQSFKRPMKSLHMGLEHIKGNPDIFAQHANRMIKRHFRKEFDGLGAHATAEHVSECFPEIWDDYYKFCFVRNPFDHSVSDFYWRKCPEKGVSFEEFLLRKKDPTRPDPERVVPHPIINWTIYTLNDRIAVDFVGRYEDLEYDLARVFRKIGLHHQIKSRSQREKGDIRQSSGRELYNEHTIELVKEIYEREIEVFGYTFRDFEMVCEGKSPKDSRLSK